MESQQPNSLLLVVIVNYRTADLTVDCLKSLEAEVQNLPGTEVVVVDNASGDNSVEQIQKAIDEQNWQPWVKLIASERNGGYAYGNNLAIRPALESTNPPQYVLLLNPDTIVRSEAIATLVQFMEKHSDIGIAGSRLEDPDGKPQRSAFRFHSILSEFEGGMRLGMVSQLLSKWKVAPEVSDVDCRTDWVAGASMIIRLEVFKDVGLLDEEYFMYYEEVDFCLQAKRKGWSCWYVPESRVVHFVGQSSGVTNTKITPKRRPLYWFESRERYFIKNYGKFYTFLADLMWMIGFIVWKGRNSIEKKPNNDPPYLLTDFWQNSILVKKNSMTTQLQNPETKTELSLWSQLKEDWIAHEKDWTRPGFRAVAVCRFGVWRMKIQPKLLRAPFSILYRAMYRHVRNVYGIEIPYSVNLGRRVIVEHQGCIVIHGNCTIGDDCVIRQGVTIGNRYLDKPLEAPQLGARVNVGAGAKILGKLVIGDDVSIGANSVVLTDIPAGKTAVGIPAKIL
ncbi:MAG: glycosyltransferase [Gloeocapsa sp. DLM2.Bin57]|nr:MAG: glycosyltransferase [Gloeocapsa sp. DLM2.Bin57]